MSRRTTTRSRLAPGTTGALVALSLGAVGLATGCSVTNPIQTQNFYDPSDGVGIDVGEVHVGNLMVISEGQGAAGTVAGFASNRGRTETRLVLEVEGTEGEEIVLGPEATVLIGPDREASLDIDEVAAVAGSKIRVDVRTDRGGAEAVDVPVMDGTLPEYADLLP